MEQLPLILNAEQAARLMGVSRTKIYELAKTPEFSSIIVNMGMRGIRFYRPKLEAWAEMGGFAAPPPISAGQQRAKAQNTD